MCYDETMATHEDYRQAAVLLWGEAGALAADEFRRLNREHFAGSVPPLPVIIGLTAYGQCVGLTRNLEGWLAAPRITLPPEIFTGTRTTEAKRQVPGGPRMVGDVLLHEMVHATLMLRGEDAGHNGEPWCRMVRELSPGVLGREIDARPVLPRRVPNPERETDPAAPKTIVVRLAELGQLPRQDLARWPHSCRPADYYAGDEPVWVPTY
jgi:hypothetical protein